MKRSIAIVGLVLLTSFGIGNQAIAQVSADGTVGTIVSPGQVFNITGGTRPNNGPNLFHSFSQFSLPTGSLAIFQNDPTVQTIFSRVTGGSRSDLDGLIQTQGGASLFLMNPNGIVFGPNAKLQLGGSFIGTTANSIKFEDGIEFSAGNLTANPLLSVKVPIGLQMGSNPAPIDIQQAKLQVADAKTLGLIGGEINQAGGTLQVGGGHGRIELAAIGENSLVQIHPASGGWQLDTSKNLDFRDLHFQSNALVSSQGEGSASITAMGRNISLGNRSSFQSYNEGSKSGGNIQVIGSSSILIQDTSFIRTEVIQGSGHAGYLNITAPKITLNNGGSISSVAYLGTGNAGNIFVTGKWVEFNNDPNYILANPDDGSVLVSVTLDQGHAGHINVTADVLKFANGSGFGNVTIGTGNSGTTTLISKVMTVEGNSGGGSVSVGKGSGGDLKIITDRLFMDTSSGYATGSYAEDGGSAGNISITARTMIARDDSGFSSDTTGNGRAGDISINADYIELDDTQINSRTQSTGNAGKIDITANTLKILNGGQLNVSTRSSGNGGQIVVNAKEIDISGESTNRTLANKNTGILSGVLRDSSRLNSQTGNGGNIIVQSESLTIRDGAFITASTSAGQGNGGNIDLDTDRLSLLNGGQIMNITRSKGNAGNITINANKQLQLSGYDALHLSRQAAYVPNQEYSDTEYNIGPFSGIYASTTPMSTGAGGNLQVFSPMIQVQDQAQLSVSSQGVGSAGNLGITAKILNLNRQGVLQAEAIAGNQGNITINLSDALILRNGSVITTRATGLASGGNIFIQSHAIIGLENSDIIASAIQGRGGNINIATRGIFGLQYRDRITPDNDITASSEFGINGNVQVNKIGVNPANALNTLPVDIVDSSRQIADRCAAAKTSSFISTGRGGIPWSPMQTRKSDRTWHDLRDTGSDRSVTTAVIKPIAQVSTPIVEASGIEVDESGTVSLVNPQTLNPNSGTCAGSMTKP